MRKSLLRNFHTNKLIQNKINEYREAQIYEMKKKHSINEHDISQDFFQLKSKHNLVRERRGSGNSSTSKIYSKYDNVSDSNRSQTRRSKQAANTIEEKPFINSQIEKFKNLIKESILNRIKLVSKERLRDVSIKFMQSRNKFEQGNYTMQRFKPNLSSFNDQLSVNSQHYSTKGFNHMNK